MDTQQEGEQTIQSEEEDSLVSPEEHYAEYGPPDTAMFPSIALIDVDQIVYAVAVSAKDDEPDHYLFNSVNQMLRKRIEETQKLCPTVESFKLFVSDKNNFRKWKDPLYKANRQEKPLAWEVVREFMEEKKGATARPFLEADDVTAMNHATSNGNTVLVDQDKDLDQIVGWRVVPSLKRGGKVVREEQLRWIGEQEATYSFYSQLLTGDTCDNISGVWGKPTNKKATAKKMLEGCTTDWDMYTKVLEEYILQYNHSVVDAMYYMTLNANALYMRRFPNDYWLPPKPAEYEDEEQDEEDNG